MLDILSPFLPLLYRTCPSLPLPVGRYFIVVLICLSQGTRDFLQDAVPGCAHEKGARFPGMAFGFMSYLVLTQYSQDGVHLCSFPLGPTMIEGVV